MVSDGRRFDELRARAVAIAYRMLGSVADAEDVAQEALLRVHRAQAAGERIESPLAYVATVATRLAIDELRSARARRESYVGTWLPEPVLTEPAGEDPARRAEMAESLSLALLIVLETLSPEQRAALLLRDAFGYDYAEIAAVIGTSEVNARQLVSRARRHVARRRPRFEVVPEEREELARRFFAAARDGDLESLEALLADDVVLHGDGGGKVPALAAPLHGRARVARTLASWARRGWGLGGATLRPVDVNGQPGALVLDPLDRPIGVLALDIAAGRIRTVASILNPDKLRHLGPPGDLRAVLERRSERLGRRGRGAGLSGARAP